MASESDITVKSPAVISLFGEHAMTYGKFALSTAIALYATCSVKRTPDRNLWIHLADYDRASMPFYPGKLELLYESYNARRSQSDYVKENEDIDPRLLPYATVAAKLIFEFNLDVFGKEVFISSNIPQNSGASSSAACLTAFTIGLTRSMGPVTGGVVADAVMMEMAREGEKVAHRYEGVGRLDILASYYGGYVSTMNGGRHESLSNTLDLVLINTGSKKSASDIASQIRKIYDTKKPETEEILEKMGRCASEGLEALSKGDIAKVGELMSKNHELIWELGVSNSTIEQIIEVAKSCGALGAKMEDGGGIVVAVGKDAPALAEAIWKEGFPASVTSVSFAGASSYLK